LKLFTNRFYQNLKDIIVTTFEMLLSHKKTELGPIPMRQLAVLSSFIKSKPE
jgi:hypothetical protein